MRHTRAPKPTFPPAQPVAITLPPAQPAKQDPQRDPPSWLEIDLPALARNVKAYLDVTRQQPQTPSHAAGPVVCGVVKKNAYGLGAPTIARKMVTAGCGMLAVYSTQEAEELVDAGLTVPLLVLSPVRSIQRTDPLYRALAAGRLHLTINDTQQLMQLSESARLLGLQIPVHLHLDTGMSRGGISTQDLTDIVRDTKPRAGVQWVGLMTHFATADDRPDYTQQQLDTFDHALKQHQDTLPRGLLLHVSNSYAALRAPRYHRQLIRPGLGLYGYAHHALRGGEIIADAPALEPIVRWCSRITQAHRYPKDSPVGYGCTWTTPRASLLGIVPVGYGDGYPLALSNKSHVRVMLGDAGYDCPMRGRVNMDQLVIDLTDAVATAQLPDHAALHAHVEVYSSDEAAPHALHKLAQLADTHCYELLCRLNPRLPRRYL